MKRYRRVLSLVLASALALTPVTAYAAEDAEAVMEQGNSAAEISEGIGDAVENLGGGVIEETGDESSPSGAVSEADMPDGFAGEGLTDSTETIEYASKNDQESPANYFYVTDLSGNDGVAYTLSWKCIDGTESANAVISTNYLDSNSDLSLPYMQGDKKVSEYRLHIELKRGTEVLGRVDKTYELLYTGITKEDVANGTKKLEDYFDNPHFSGRELDFEERDLQTQEKKDIYCGTQTSASYARLDYTLTAQAINDPSLVKMVASGNGVGSIPILSADFRLDFGDKVGAKQVDCYKLKVVFRYDGEEVYTNEATYDVRFDPIYVEKYESVDFRQGETKELGVSARKKWDDKDIGDLRYQWYRGDTKIEGEDLKNTYVKVEDYNVTYKCVVSATKLQQAYPDIVLKEIAKVFNPREQTGYRLKDSSGRNQEVYLGEPATLFIKHDNDPGYTFDYKWERITQSSNSNREEYGYVALSGNTGDTLHIGKTTEDDLKPVYGWKWQSYDPDKGEDIYVPNPGELRPNYQLTVIVYKGTEKKPGQEMGRYTYGFYLTRRADGLVEIDSNLERVDKSISDYRVESKEIEKGEDVELYLTSKVNDASCTVEKKWYRNVRTVDYDAKSVSGDYYVPQTDPSGNELLDENGNPILVYETEEKIPVGETAIDTLECYSDYGLVTLSDNRSYYTYRKKIVTYGQEITVSENGIYKMAGKDAAGADADNRGRYVVDVKTKQQGKDLPSESSVWAIDLEYDTDLDAYQKTENIYASLGESVTMEVIASNKDGSRYPISYEWSRKKRRTDNEWIPLENAKDKAYVISQLKEDDYGIYRVRVSDISGADIMLQFVVDKKGVVFYTPERSVFRRSIGDSVTMEVKGEIPASTTVSYNWYCTDEYIVSPGDPWHEQDPDWQILNEEKASYTFTVLNEEHFGTYRCDVRYRSDINGEYETRSFYFVVADAAQDIVLERTTPELQYKRPGESASYGVRYKTDSSVVKDADIQYQWFDRSGATIEGATGPVYQIDSLKAKDFGRITCALQYAGYTKNISFETRCYSDVVIDKSNRRIEAEAGTDVDVAVVVKENPANRNLTYKWYFGNSIIDGAINGVYTIPKIGENQFGSYRCEIYDEDCLIDTYEVNVVRRSEQLINVSQNSAAEVSVSAGGTAVFAVTASSNRNMDLSYQWYYDGSAIGGATEPTYTIKYVLPSMAGEYWCVVKDPEGATAQSPGFILTVGSGLAADSGYRHEYDLIGYSVKIGGETRLTADAKIEEGYKLFYQWYKVDGAFPDHSYDLDNAIHDATSSELQLTGIKLEDLGYYACAVSDGEKSVILWYYVYVDNGLVVEPGIYRPRAAADGSVTMFVEAKADEKIKYVWEREVKTWEVIPNATTASYKIPKLTKSSFGRYRCTVSTSGESRTYVYKIETMYEYSQSREFAEQGDSVTFNANIINRATDAKYTYKWYAAHPVTGSEKEVSNAAASYTAKTPSVKLDRNAALIGYKAVDYVCRILRDDEDEKDEGAGVEERYTLNVFPSVTYSKTLPKTSHPFNKRVDVKGYKVDGAKSIKITLDSRSERVLVVDAAGHGHWMGATKNQGKVYTLTLSGSKVIFVANSRYTKGIQEESEMKGDPLYVQLDTDNPGYGYEAKSIVNAASSSKPKVPAKGQKSTVGNLSYKVTKSSTKAGTVSVAGVKKKTLTSAAIPKTVKISGYTFKVTAIGAKAFTSCKKLKKVTIETNVTSIGKQAFKGCAQLKTITIKTTKLTSKNVGSQAFKGISANATIKVPKNKLASYKKILKAKGVGKKVKIQKIK